MVELYEKINFRHFSDPKLQNAKEIQSLVWPPRSKQIVILQSHRHQKISKKVSCAEVPKLPATKDLVTGVKILAWTAPF